MLAGVEEELYCELARFARWLVSKLAGGWFAEDDALGVSWVSSAAGSGFPLQGLPYCAFVSGDGSIRDGLIKNGSIRDGSVHLGVGIGDFILDLHGVARAGLLDSLGDAVRAACAAGQLNELMECGPVAWAGLRRVLTGLLRDDVSEADRLRVEPLLIPQAGAWFCRPVGVGNYTDFYASIEHATNVGRLFRPDQPLMPNYKWLPVGYHGRASSLVVSRSGIRRPWGQMRLGDEAVFGPSLQLDYELEVAAYVGTGNALGEPVSVGDAEGHVFGLSLLNDWSARDVQSWEYQPLGPFLGKSFATSVGAWVVPMEALEPYRVPGRERDAGDPKLLGYLDGPADKAGFDVRLEVWLSTERMRAEGMEPERLSRGNLRGLYWSFGQMIAHHTSNGCNLMVGDLIASGTVSGAKDGSQGCLLEMTWRGAEPLQLANGEVRGFLEDGDEVILRAVCEREGLPRVSFGECRGRVLPAVGGG